MNNPIDPKLAQDRLKQTVIDAYNRHLRRAGGEHATAYDWTYHHFKHYGFEDEQWELVKKTLEEIKNIK